VQNSNIEDGSWSGPGNISIDPLFRLSGPRALSIRVASPCVDVGANSGIDQDRTNVDDDPNNDTQVIPWDMIKYQRVRDFDHDPCDPNSPNDPIVDMGSYEICNLPDVDGNGAVDLTDLAMLLTCFGLDPCTAECCWGDFDNDSDVDLGDLASLLTVFGAVCPAVESCNEDRPAPPDPLTEWLQSADPEDVVEWWENGGSESLTPP